MRPSPRQQLTVSFAVVALLLALVAPVGAAQENGLEQAGTDALARNSWIVTLEAGANPAVEGAALSRAAGGEVGLVYRHALNGFQFKGSAQAANALTRSKHVVSVQPDSALFLTETLPFGIERVYAYGLGGFQGAYQQGFRGNGARIAILDTGIDLDHPDLVNSIDQGLGKNCVNAAAAPNDGYGHGTHTAGTAAAPINGVGVAGIASQARLVAVKMFDDLGNSSQALALCAFDHIIGLNTDGDASNDVDVASMSWGEQRTWGTCETDALHGAVCRAEAAGIIQVAGAGNSATNAENFVPAAYPEVVSVSAIADFDGQRGGLAGCKFILELFASECDDSLAVFSNYGSSIEVTAPGVNIYSTWKDGGWKTSSGTSMATPHVSGIMALMAAAAPGLTPAAARDIIKATGECPNGSIADSDGAGGCAGQGAWRDDPDGIPEPMANALEASLRASNAPPPSDPVPPSAPALSATAFDDHVDLSWTPPASDGGAQIDRYHVYRGDTSGSATFYATVDTGTTFEDLSVTTGSTYWYEVAAENSAGVGTRSSAVSATIPEPPPPPPPAEPPSAPTLSVSPGNGLVNLSWTVPAADGGAAITAYEIYRGTASGSLGLWQTVDDSWTSIQNIGLTNGTAYYYQVAAVNSAGIGERSNEASATPAAPLTRPSAPRSLKAQKVSGGIQLTWLAPTSNGGSPITSYRVYRTGGAGAVVFTVQAAQLSLLDGTGLSRTYYAYVVSAVNSVGESQASNIVTVKTQ
jgi:subtilisin family serine protease